MTCGNCGAVLKEGKKFCTECGARVVSRSPLVATHAASCSQCGTPLKEGQRFCTNCGTQISLPFPQPVYSSNCPQCGVSLKKNVRFCSSCGAATDRSTLPSPATAETISPPAVRPKQAIEMWEPPPWPRGLVPPPPPLTGAIHNFSIRGNIATDIVSKFDISDLLSGSQLRAALTGIIKTCEAIIAELRRIVSEAHSILSRVPSSPPVKEQSDPVESNTLSAPARRCPNCHQAVAAGKKFCTGCGLLLT